MGGVCWISPRNCESASSTFSRVTCRQGAVRTRAPSLSYESVSHPSKHVVRYSYQGINSCVSKNRTQHAPLRSPRNRSISSCLSQHRPLHGAVVQRTIPRVPNQIQLTEDTICERIQRASLSNFHVVSPPLFTRRLFYFFLVNEETRVTYESFQLVHDVHGRWSRWFYYAEEAR
jgi:hypothetical protein